MKILINPWMAFLTLLGMLAISAMQPAFVESVRLRYFDTLILSKPPTDNAIVVLNIDEQAIEKHGQWPFDRRVYAAMVEDLYARNAGLVILTVLMPDADRMGGDDELAKALAEFPVILGNVPGNTDRNRPRASGAVVINDEHVGTIVNYPGIISNLPSLEAVAAGVGITATLPEIDGVNRRIPLVVASNGRLYPSVSMETLRVLAGDRGFQVRLNANGIEALRIPRFGPIATDELGRIWIDWSQRSVTHTPSSLPDDLGGAVVIVGASAPGIANPVPTAAGARFPQEVHAATIATMANDSNIQRPDWAPASELLGTLLVGMIIILLSRWTYVGLAASALAVTAPVLISFWSYDNHSFLIDATAITVTLVLVALHVYGVKFVSEFLQKQAIKKQFEGYASPTVVKLLQENPSLIKDGSKREVSICFSDLRGFTPLGESFGDDVKGLTLVMNGYMDAISQPVLDANGMIIKYIGDATMHIHNAPVDDPHHPATAVRTALNMLRAVDEFNVRLTAQGRPPVGMGAGINTGLGYVGEMGSTKRHSYDVLGDAVSTAARIESKCKEYGCLLLLGENTVKRCNDQFFFLKIDDLAVKGKTIGIRIYTVLDDVTPEYTSSRELHDLMHDSYLKQDFDRAIMLCRQLEGHFGGKMDKYYDMWIERCEYMLTQELPADWNGVFVATTK